VPNPYKSVGPTQFWRSAISDIPSRAVMPIPSKRFSIPDGARIATAGSCFAQNVANVLVSLPNINFLQTEVKAAGQPMFSAQYGNIYTARQLRQLFREALAVAPGIPVAWRRSDDRWVDAQRPTMFADGFASPEAVMAARSEHLASVRRMFTDCSIFIFTLGLTEAWVSASGDTVFPVAPGVVAEDVTGGSYKFQNFTYEETINDLTDFMNGLRGINPDVAVILTVSPVPLVATYTTEHVLVATTHSKAILRAVCSAAEATWTNVYYFPAYEIISGHYNGGAYYDANKRTVSAVGVEHVMRVFQATYFGKGQTDPLSEHKHSMLEAAYAGGKDIICDEDWITNKSDF
jgi:GSCFA family